MEFRVLGSFEVLVDGQQIPLGGARQRAVLAILLLHRGEVVSVDRVVDELWGERPPDTATKTVQVYVSRLRKALGEGVLVTRGGGYVLELDPDDVDADRFERLAGEGREALDRGEPRAAAKSLAEALELWRGPPLTDFAYESFAQNEIARLEELRLVALEDRIDADLALGRHAALVSELEALVAEHPTRERLRGQLMLALYRAGRQSEALESYRDAQRTLQEELGLEPGPELQQLEQSILNQDPAIEAPRREGPLAVLGGRRRGGVLLAFGGGLLLAAAVAAIVSGGDDGAELAEPNSLAVIDPESNRVVDTVPTGIDPADVAADADHVWVANRGDGSVTQVDSETKAVVGTTSADTRVGGIAAGADGVWIADSRGEELVRLDPAFPSAARSIRLAPRPEELDFAAVNPVAVGHDAVWVPDADGAIARVDPGSYRIADTIPVGNSPTSIATGAGGVWVADAIDNSVTRIDPASANAVTAPTPVGQGPSAIAVGEGAVWVANTQDDTVSRIDPRAAAVTQTIPVGDRPTGIAAGGGAVWVANSLGGTVSRIDPEANRVEATIEVGEAPQGVTVAHDLVWVTVQASAAAPDAPSAPAGEDVVRVLKPAPPGSIDPATLGIGFDELSYATCALLYNYPDRPFPVGSRLVPELAAGEPLVSDDGRTYRFRIRPGFRFSPPSNEPVTAAAFKRALERVLSPTINSYGRLCPPRHRRRRRLLGRPHQDPRRCERAERDPGHPLDEAGAEPARAARRAVLLRCPTWHAARGAGRRPRPLGRPLLHRLVRSRSAASCCAATPTTGVSARRGWGRSGSSSASPPSAESRRSRRDAPTMWRSNRARHCRCRRRWRIGSRRVTAPAATPPAPAASSCSRRPCRPCTPTSSTPTATRSRTRACAGP